MTCNANCAELSGLYANALNLTIRGTPKHYAAWHHDKLPALVSSKMPGRQMFLLHGQTLFRKKKHLETSTCTISSWCEYTYLIAFTLNWSTPIILHLWLLTCREWFVKHFLCQIIWTENVLYTLLSAMIKTKSEFEYALHWRDQARWCFFATTLLA